MTITLKNYLKKLNISRQTLPKMPNIQYIPELLSPALAMAVLALVQSAALTRTIREPDGTIANTNRDFVGQGLANIAGGLFQGLPSGGRFHARLLMLVLVRKHDMQTYIRACLSV